MVHGSRALGREILKECAAHAHIDQLNAAADTEDRQAPLAGHRKQRKLEEITVAAWRTQQGRGLRAIPGRVHVLTAGEDQAVYSLEHAAGQRRAHQR